MHCTLLWQNWTTTMRSLYGILARCIVCKLSKFHPLFWDLVRASLLLTTAGSRGFVFNNKTLERQAFSLCCLVQGRPNIQSLHICYSIIIITGSRYLRIGLIPAEWFFICNHKHNFKWFGFLVCFCKLITKWFGCPRVFPRRIKRCSKETPRNLVWPTIANIYKISGYFFISTSCHFIYNHLLL